MENDYYTVSDIEIITGYDEEDVLFIIKQLNEEIMKKYISSQVKPLLFDEMIEKEYFLRGMESLIWWKCWKAKQLFYL